MRSPLVPFPAPAPQDIALERLGADAAGDEELLAVLLGSGRAARRRARDAMDLAGGLAGLARLDVAAMAADQALGPRRGRMLAAAFELGRRAAVAWPEPAWSVRAPADVAERLIPAMGTLEREELRVLLLNTKNVVTALRTVYVGNLAGSSVRVGEVYRDAVRACAAGILVVHNHPSGDPTPSAEDLRITGDLAAAGSLLDIELMDHLVIGHRRWVSLRALGALTPGQRATTR